ncbi:neurofilament medium polypeptide [Aplysia californica]|uniref:Neurofilament medium polypeptide n=1 Tax=Aplysia californica TaxID=6500 RepID=A0ABM1VXE5_APLCA|nr:neurofilament medium polypeptide [Aplysia californica]
MTSAVRSWKTFDLKRGHTKQFSDELPFDPGKKRWAKSSLRRDAYRVTLRHRTLDDYPMQHGLADAVRMLERRRQEQQTQKRNMAAALNESRNLNSYSRRRFDVALGVRRDEKLPPPSETDQTLFWREPRPSWTRPRHHSVSGSVAVKREEPPVKLAERPDSEPPLRSCLPRRTFNHARGSPEAYPGIRQLVKEYNTELRVVCTTPGERSCAEAWQSGRASVLSDVLLVPVQEDMPEDGGEEEDGSVMSLLSLQEDEGEDEVEGEELFGDQLDGRKEGAATSPDGEKTTVFPSVPELRGSPGKKKKATSPEPKAPPTDDVESERSTPSPSPPWRCWVDDATVSSIAAPSEPEAAAEDGLSPSPSPALLEGPGQTLPGKPATKGSPDTAALASKTQSKLDAKTATALSAEKPPSPSPAETPLGKKKASAKGRRRKEPEPVELPEPPPPVEEVKEEAEVEEVTVEVVEEEVEPVLPLSICPSSEGKSHQAEVKLWLRKSPFSAASRSVPIYWS